MTTVNIAVLFTDIVGSTEMQSKLSPETADEFRRDHFLVLRQAIAETGGTEVKNLGDGLMAAFDSASSAISCAVAMHQGVEIDGRGRPERVEIRIGLSGGEVTREDGDYFGDPVIEAARLCAVCEPGHILASTVVALMAGRRNPHPTQSIGPIRLKGLPGESDVVNVLWEPLGPTDEELRRLPTVLSDPGHLPFVGREEESKTLDAAYNDAAAGSTRLVLVAGEPGIGKTRLVSELATRVLNSGGLILAGRSDEMVGIPYQPFAEALRFMMGQPGGVEDLGQKGSELTRLVPELAQVVLGLGPPLSGSAESERFALFDGVREWLTTLSEARPVLLILDDLHWADMATLLLLRHVVVIHQVPHLLVVGTYRDTDLDRKHPLSNMLADFRRRTEVSRIALAGLEADDLRELITAGDRNPGEAILALASSLREDTDGNPFFVGEVLRHLAETHAITQEDGQWVANSGTAETFLPEGIRDVIGRRVSVLPDETQRLLSSASVAGTRFTLDLLATILEVSVDAALDALEPALTAHLVVETGIGTYKFAHALVRSTLETELSTTRRARLHLAVATALEQLHEGDLDSVMEELAYHWGETGGALGTDAPVRYAQRAGELAGMRGAPDEAARWYRLALERLDGADRRLEAVLLNAVGQAESRARQPNFLEALLKAAEIATEMGEHNIVVDALTREHRGDASAGSRDPEPAKIEALERALASPDYDSLQRTRLTMALGQELLHEFDFTRRRELFEQALALTDQLSDPFDRLVVNGRNIGSWPYSLVTRPNVERYFVCTPDQVGRAWEQPDRELTGHAIWLYFWGSLFLGDPSFRIAVEEQRRLYSVFPSIGAVTELLSMEVNQALIDGRFQDLDDLLREWRSSAGRGDITEGGPGLLLWQTVRETLGTRASLPTLSDMATEREKLNTPVVDALLAVSLAEAGEAEQAADMVDRANAAGFDVLRDDATYPITATSWAQAAAIVGHGPACRALYDLLLPTCGMHQATGFFYAGSTDRYLGVLAAAVGDDEAADQWFASAVDGHERMKSPAWLVRSRLDWAECLAAREEVDRARELALSALDGIGSLELHVSRARADVVLAALPA